jgi:hypothetical protein
VDPSSGIHLDSEVKDDWPECCCCSSRGDVLLELRSSWIPHGYRPVWEPWLLSFSHPDFSGSARAISIAQKSGIHCRPPSFTVSGSSELRLLELRGLELLKAFTAGGELRPALKEFIVGRSGPFRSLTVSNLRNVWAATLTRGLRQRLR